MPEPRKRRVPLHLTAAIGTYADSIEQARSLADAIYNDEPHPLRNGRPAPDRIRFRYDEGGFIPTALSRVELEPDECVVRRDGSCVRADHPTEASDCAEPDA